MEVGTFTCSICGEVSHDICLYCTKDGCGNHLCDRCHRCSDCCACDTPVFNQEVEKPAAHLNGTAPPEPTEIVAPSYLGSADPE